MSKERLETEPSFETIIPLALHEAYKVHQALGSRGEELIQKNQFGETALRIDIEAENAVINFLREQNVPVRIMSEEHGQVDISPEPRYLGILDGLDGSNRYQAGRGTERYGTMLGVFSGLDPQYGDYISGGMMEHSTNRLFTAERGVGSFVIDKNGRKTPIHASAKTALDPETRIYINGYWEVCRKVFLEKLRSFRSGDPRAYVAYFSDLSSGNTDLVLTCTGKNNLEIAIGYGFVKEAGGVVVDLAGNDLGDKKFLKWGQKEQLPVIAASTLPLARALIKSIGQ